jgi:hypothetical protein
MSLRWRLMTDLLLCAAKHHAQAGDCYIDDRLHYQLSLIGAICPRADEHESGQWDWVCHTPHWDQKQKEKAMLTLRFETDARGSEQGDTTFVIEAKQFRTESKRDGSIDVIIANEHGVDIYYPIGIGPGSYDRCYVMNAEGATVARYRPSDGLGPKVSECGPIHTGADWAS